MQYRDIDVPENNETVTVCVRRTGDTTQDYSVTLEAKENTVGLIADGKMYYICHTKYTVVGGEREKEDPPPYNNDVD